MGLFRAAPLYFLEVDINKYKIALGTDWCDYEKLVEREVRSDNTLLSKINDHLFSTSGKKIRPLLVLISAKACAGIVSPLAVVCAAASELIHTATLLHDDVVDDSDMRRGVLTVKSLFSPGASLLMGDYWLSKAVFLLVKHNTNFEIIQNYAKTIEDLAEGEMLQMEKAELDSYDVEKIESDYFEIIKRKTASLFIASVRNAAIASNASSAVIEAMSEYALHLGLSFQIRDDILDYSLTPLDGKDIGSDLSERKITLPLIGALKENPLSHSYIDLIKQIDITDKNSSNETIINKIKEFVYVYEGIDYAKALLYAHLTIAIDSLSILPDSIFKKYLIEIASSLDFP